MRIFIVILMLATSCMASREASEAPTTQHAVPARGAVDRPTPRPPAAEQPLRLHDDGVFSDLNAELVFGNAGWIDTSAALVIAQRDGRAFRFVHGVPVALADDQTPDIVVEQFHGADRDQDGIPDQFDVLRGAKKAALNEADYGSPYRELEYPGGDVPREEGVCTDTLVRAVRNAGLDLQQTLHEHIVADPGAFPMVKKPNANIDHRRVKTLLPHFARRWTSLDDADPWFPGDIVFMQTMGDRRPDHVGIVSDSLGPSGAPLVINNWTDGYSTAAMDIAASVPVTHRFRMPASLALPAPHGGVDGLLHRHDLTVPAMSRQLVVVTAMSWNSVRGSLRRYERRESRWAAVGEPFTVTLGARGLAAGRGLHERVSRAPSSKSEGDRRAPAGVFDFGTAFGRATAIAGDWPYRRVTSSDRFIDDPDSPHYNSWQVSDGDDDWRSAERLDQYVLGLVVNHNMPARRGDGSAIFLHTWNGDPAATLGCTAMDIANLRTLLAWLEPAARPVLVQVAGHVYGSE